MKSRHIKEDTMKIQCNIDTEIKTLSRVLSDGRKVENIRLNHIPAGAKEIVITAEWDFPIVDIAGKWHPACRFDRALKADWAHGERSMSAVSAPIQTLFSAGGKNRATVAVSETLKPVNMNLGVHEEEGTMKCKVDIYIGETEGDTYEADILEDYRDVRYEQSIREAGLWWENECGLKPLEVPEDAKDPMYSFWYSYHQDICETEIEKECGRAKELGFRTVIVDDGWQTDDTNRGYAFCGDWKVAEKKIKDMRAHVERVHQMGMKYLLWFSVPYVGMKSQMWKLFHDKLIGVDEEQQTGILDIRYPEVRTYLKNIYVKAVSEWGLDGLKLDFIDEFYERKTTPSPNENMDCVCLQIALDKLLSETIEELRIIREDILIEFRQRYIGPSIRRYGNMLRVTDCPESGLSNRVYSIDLRLLSGRTAVHSDPIVWNKNETPETAALQIIESLFATMQFSVKIDEMGDRMKKMVRHYMGFMREHRGLLQDAPVCAKEPQNLYPEVSVENEKEKIIALYSADRIVRLDIRKERTIIVNGTQANEIYVKAEGKNVVKIIQTDCCGQVVKEESRVLSGIQSLDCTMSGQIEIRKQEEK